MKKKIISLAAVLVLASMMLVMFTGCTEYKTLKVCNIKSKEDFTVELKQFYDTDTGKYDTNKFRVEVSFVKKAVEGPGDIRIGSIECDYEKLKNGVQVEVPVSYFKNLKPSIYITGVTLDKTGKISDSCTPICEMRLEGRQYKATMKNV